MAATILAFENALKDPLVNLDPTLTGAYIMVLSERCQNIQKTVEDLTKALATSMEDQATKGSLNRLIDLIEKNQQDNEKYQAGIENRLRVLEDWRTGILAQIHLSYVISGIVSFLIGILIKYWK